MVRWGGGVEWLVFEFSQHNSTNFFQHENSPDFGVFCWLSFQRAFLVSGLLKARHILNKRFGRVYMTFGEPISIRKYFNTSLQRSELACKVKLRTAQSLAFCLFFF